MTNALKKKLIKIKDVDTLIDIITKCMVVYRNEPNTTVEQNIDFKYGANLPEFHWASIPRDITDPEEIISNVLSRDDNI